MKMMCFLTDLFSMIEEHPWFWLVVAVLVTLAVTQGWQLPQD